MCDFSEDLVTQIPKLRRYAATLSKSRSQADDLVQETLLRALSKAHLFQPGTNLRAWLFAIMHNQHVNFVRRNVSLGIAVEPTEAEERLTISAPQIDRLIMRDLDRALNQLPAEQRQVLMLAGTEQLSYEEIAEITKVPVGTVRSRLSRGRDMLHGLMGNRSARTRSHTHAPELAA